MKEAKDRLGVYLKMYEYMVKEEEFFIDWNYGLCNALIGTGHGNFYIREFKELAVFEYDKDGFSYWWNEDMGQGDYNARLVALGLAIAMVEDEIKK